MEKQLTAEYLLTEGVKYEKHGKETVFSISGIKKLFRKAFVKDANVIEIDGEGKTRKFCRISDVEFRESEGDGDQD